MLLLVTIAQPQIEKHRHPNLGRLVQPRHYWRVRDTARSGVAWAADNDAFGGFGDDEARRFEEMLAACAGLPGCKFVCAPDVVGDAAQTAVLFERWVGAIRDAELPVGFVAQDGLAGVEDVPWSRIDALFLGGSTDFKLGPLAESLVREARRRGLWVHMGRVNTARRIRYARTIGCDSVDGSQFARWRDTWLPIGLNWVSAPAQDRLFEGESSDPLGTILGKEA